MGTFNGNAKGGRFAAGHGGKHKQAGAWIQILLSVLLLMDLFLLYTIAMQLTHQQKAFEASPAVNWTLLAVFALGAIALSWGILRTRAWKRLLCLFLIFCICYLTVVFSDLPLIKKYREMWISTAWSTMRHQGLATYYFPPSVMKVVTEREKEGRDAQVGNNTQDTFNEEADQHEWLNPEKAEGLARQDTGFRELTPEQQAFYGLFYELDRESAEAYFEANPKALANGYMNVLVNESALNKKGTSIQTKLGEKVLAIDAQNQILILEVDCDGSRGVLAIAKLPSRLHLYAAKNLPYMGETAGSIAQRNGGVMALTGSGFDDPGGVGNGGRVAGYAMCDGKEHKGAPFEWGYKRIELRKNDWFYITDTFDKVHKDTTDAMEFSPAMIINGKKLDPGIWTSQNPRACIGQSVRGEILMLAVEGRTLASPGCSVSVCADVLLKHEGITAMNCDGGTTAMLWYRGEPLIRCSNASIPQGRHLPNAWVYVGD